MFALFGLGILSSAACSATPELAATGSNSKGVYASWPDPLETMPRGQEQVARVCARPGQDIVRDALCAGLPAPTSLSELQARVGLGSDQIGTVNAVKTGDMRAISISAHSTALGRRSVSAINPRLIAVHVSFTPSTAIGPKNLGTRMHALAFARGEQFAEIVASDLAEKRFNFYVLGFRQVCNEQVGGCKASDLLTEAVESNWTEVSLYDESDLANTVMDCATCHQPNGPDTPKLLRMQEIDSPWTHWLSPNTEGGKALLDDYMAAHGDETYAGMPATHIAKTDPNSLATMVFLATSTQPNKFDSLLIEREVMQSSAAMGGSQPADNSIPGMSAIWRSTFDAATRGEAIAVPYFNVKVSDASKLAAMTAAYQAFRAGELTAAQLPDVRDVFPDDPERLAEMGIGTQPGLTGTGVLMAACAQCHNERLDQSVSRARFRADLVGMSRAEKDLAITRLLLPPEHALAMPPARLRQLTPEARDRAIETLQQ
jgi:mono/diheme cytochrome c family protein